MKESARFNPAIQVIIPSSGAIRELDFVEGAFLTRFAVRSHVAPAGTGVSSQLDRGAYHIAWHPFGSARQSAVGLGCDCGLNGAYGARLWNHARRRQVRRR